MRASIAELFGSEQPRALILDDNNRSRTALTLEFSGRGFAVEQCKSVEEFESTWRPGIFDVIVADWELSAKNTGDAVLRFVRKTDWDVPFVLLSGRLGDSTDRAEVLQALLDGGPSEFVVRGDRAIDKVADLAEGLIERRDIALVRLILSLRPAALERRSVTTSGGPRSVADELAAILRSPEASHKAARPLPDAWRRRKQKAKKK